MSDHDSRPEYSIVRLDRAQRHPWAEGGPAGNDADEVGERIRAAQRKADRSALGKKPAPLKVEQVTKHLPDTVIKRVNVDEVCRETLTLAALLGNEAIVIG